MKKKVIYTTQWVQRDIHKEYPHGWGFEAPVIEFSQDRDPAEVAKICREELSNDEFMCIGVTAREWIDGEFELLGIMPGPQKDSEEWAILDISVLLDDANFGDKEKIRQISSVVSKFLNQQKS